jgi:hypothetical protein
MCTNTEFVWHKGGSQKERISASCQVFLHLLIYSQKISNYNTLRGVTPTLLP